MPAGTTPIFPQAPIIGIGRLTSNTAITARTMIVGTTGLTQVTANSTNGTRIDAIEVIGQGTTVATIQDIWINDGTNSFLYDDISLGSVTANNTVSSVSNTINYTNLTLPDTYRLFTSQQVSANVTVFAFGGTY
jgi:flagellar capping protein FliD